MIERFCSGGLPQPRFLRLIGSKSFRMRHSPSVRSPRLKQAFLRQISDEVNACEQDCKTRGTGSIMMPDGPTQVITRDHAQAL